MFNDRFRYRFADVAAFDPASLALMGAAGSAIGGTAPTIAAGSTLAGGAISAMASIFGGKAAKQAGLMQQQADEFKEKQAEQDASLEVSSAQVKAADTAQKTSLLESTSTARAAASGVDAGVGSAATNVGDIAKRGSYLEALDLYNGQVKATGLLNEARGYGYSGEVAALEGEEKQTADDLAAAGTLAGSLGSSFKQYKSLS